MPVLRETLEADVPVEDAFAFIADFANASRWDPGVVTSERIDDGPLGVGARYRIGIRLAGRISPMEYRVTTFDPPHRVVLEGAGASVAATDEIRFHPTDRGTRLEYIADIRLQGIARVLGPFTGGTFRRIARDARTGLERTLAERATPGPAPR